MGFLTRKITSLILTLCNRIIQVLLFKHMIRRQIIKAIGIATLPIFGGSFVVDLLGDLAKMHVCRIEIKFPTKLNINKFQESRSQWMNVSAYDQILDDLQRNGSLIKTERSVEDGKIQISYYFKTASAHNQFVEIVNSTNAVSDSMLRSAGYEYSRQYLRI